MRRWSQFFGIMMVFCLPAAGQQKPLRIDDAQLLETGRIRLELGMEFLQKQKYSLSGLEGDLTRAGIASIGVGVGQ